MVSLMMENSSEDSTKPSAATPDGPPQDEAVARPDEEVFKKPTSPSRTQVQVAQPSRGEDDAVFKKPAFPTKTKRQAIKVEEEDDDDGEAVFRRPIFQSRPLKQFIKSEEEEDAVFKKPTSVSKTKQVNKMNEEEDVVFKKPVFISKAQRQTTKAEGQQQEEGSSSSSSSDEAASKAFKSPAQSLTEKSAAIPYKEPKWSGVPQGEYSFEVLKGGIIVETVPLNRPFIVIGRQSQCDVVLEHPSLSRFHCVIQYRAVAEEGATAGFYAYDLGSTHGSFHNKHQMKPHTYYRLHVGHMLKLAGSTRTLLLQGPDEDMEPESDLTVTELMKVAEERKKKLQRLETGEEDEDEEEEGGKKRKAKEGSEKTKEGGEDAGVNWGMREDAEDEEEEEGEEDEEGKKNPFASSSDDLHLDDPKKTLRGWFERHGYDPPSYTIEDTGPGCCRCSVELPVETKAPVVVSVDHRGKRKEAVVQCAMEACRTLDRRNLLRQAKHESHQQRKRDWAENDYYDSDEDDFLDRTGDIQRRRLKRMKASGSAGQEGGAETYDSLIKKYRNATEELADLERKLAEAEAIKEASKAQRGGEGGEDDLDSFMHSLKSQVPDKHKRVTWKLRAIELRKDELKLRRLVNIARPLGVPELKPYQSMHGTGAGGSSSLTRKTGQAGLGVRLKGLSAFTTTPSQPKEPEPRVHKIFLEEEPKRKIKLKRLDEDDDDDVKPVVKESRPFKMRDEVRGSQARQSPSRPTHTMPSDHAMKTELVTTESQTTDAKKVMEEKPDIPAQEVLSKASEKHLPDKEKKPTQVSSEAAEDEETSKKAEDQNQESSTAGSSQPEKKARVLGPTLPPHLAHLKTSTQSPAQPRKKEKKRKKYDEDDPNYDSWVPPSQQSGDGRTALNDKLGY
ncbi:kanadaptin-like isoform X1 [Eriocheir sinensis]|uniref:kanadaptin-like isoform X1 n=1 Tax=Eriocheir sinensis TaxID=95602 RepID=UPI0021C652F2|nr:kanadaptin-like isoform X1 [Eriocheir sinensis]